MGIISKVTLMPLDRFVHLLLCPFTGLGLYQGFRGERWLRNRLQIFKQFVIPSLLNQTSKNFILWFAWRYQEKSNRQVSEFTEYLQTINELKTVHTFAGIPFWDDKYSEEVAKTRLIDAIHGSLGELINIMGEADYILETIQPSDDCYEGQMVEGIQQAFQQKPLMQAVGFQKGYVMDYRQKKIAEWNPTTIPPFFTIKFPREVFVDPLRHAAYAGYKSHENIADNLDFGFIGQRGFIVGIHGENISTIFNHPFTGQQFDDEQRDKILTNFGLQSVAPLKLKASWRKAFLRKLPFGWQKKLRYWLGEKFANRFYEFIRG